MKIQINEQTCNGVWGRMVTVWDGAECLAMQWSAC